MKFKLISFAVALVLMQARLCCSSTGLAIHLASEATVESENLTLGQVAEVTGDESLAAKAREIGLGRISFPGQKITIDRSLIISRLACSPDFIGASNPVLSGADAVTVTQATKVIKGESFVGSAASFLAGSIGEQSIARWEQAREPAALVLPNQAQNVELSPRLVSRGANGQATTEVSVVADSKLIGTRRVVFRPKYNTRRAVTVTDMAAGMTLTPDNTRIEKVVSDEPESADWAAPYGLAVVRNLAAGTVIGPGMARPPRPQVIIERNQNICIRIDRPGLVVTALGKAMQQGRLGECIKVQNIDSQRVILARVNEDGTVEPVF
jgi:flagella basal body P-ring formation protein FlgA